jgi:hypothetical protein
LVSKIDLLANYEVIEPLWRGGQTIHWLIAILLFVWGLILIRSKDEDALEDPSLQAAASEAPQEVPQEIAKEIQKKNLAANFDPSLDQSPDLSHEAGYSMICHGTKKAQGSYGFLALILPCPVCLSVVTMSLACLVLYFPNQALLGTALLYVGFVLAAGAAGLSLIFNLLGHGENLERSLGLAMITIASYFMISALVLPQFGQIDRVYRLASYSEESAKSLPLNGVWLLVIILALAFLGFLWGRFRARRGQKWT